MSFEDLLSPFQNQVKAAYSFCLKLEENETLRNACYNEHKAIFEAG